MATVISGMSPSQIRRNLEAVDSQLEGKIEEIILNAINFAKMLPRDQAQEVSPYILANRISTTALEDLSKWSEEMFPLSPEKEIAEAFIKGCVYRFLGPSSIQPKIRDLLSSKC